MKLTPDTLANAYGLLRQTAPFDRWKLPRVEDVKFVVSRSRNTFGMCGTPTKTRAKYKITVSSAMHSRLSRVLETMAHEMCHAALDIPGTKRISAHGREFHKLANQVCRHHPDFERAVF